jgi:hypothetical protein
MDFGDFFFRKVCVQKKKGLVASVFHLLRKTSSRSNGPPRKRRARIPHQDFRLPDAGEITPPSMDVKKILNPDQVV